MGHDEKGQIGEDFVNHIAYRSFLKYWCYPGPRNITEDFHEICDLLIVFESTCLIVSVKNYEFKGNYDRFFRSTIEKAIKQINGAERTLLRDKPLLLEHPDREPELFEKSKITDFYRIIVNLSTHTKFYQTSFFEKGKNIAVMDAEAWNNSIMVLDTLPDFIGYLKARFELFKDRPAFMFPREEFDFSANDAQSARRLVDAKAVKNSGLSTILGTELDLITNYIKNGFKFSEELLDRKDMNLSMHIDGQWEKFKSSALFTEKANFEKDSYFIDNIVKKHIIGSDRGHHLSKMLFSLNRIERAIFARHFLKYHRNVVDASQDVRMNRTHFVGLNLHMVFLCYNDECEKEELDEILEFSSIHHHYLHNFNCKEVGTVGMSKTSERYVFGYSKFEEKPPADLIKIYEKYFKLKGWKIKEEK